MMGQPLPVSPDDRKVVQAVRGAPVSFALWWPSTFAVRDGRIVFSGDLTVRGGTVAAPRVFLVTGWELVETPEGATVPRVEAVVREPHGWARAEAFNADGEPFASYADIARRFLPELSAAEAERAGMFLAAYIAENSGVFR